MKFQAMTLLMISLMACVMFIYLFTHSMFISIEIPFVIFSSMNFKISMILDWMSTMFLSTVLYISSMILFFSMSYIPTKEHKQFSLILIMFVTSMSILILSNNLIFILLGWDGLGLSSYILVTYYQNPSSSASGSITILSNRVGDIMLLISIAILFISSNWNFQMNKDFPLISLILIMIAAASKSAQLPFSAWLPAAMAAPTPISALVHSSTLVTAGVFLLIRTMDYNHPMSLIILLSASSLTAIFAGMAANWEQDMKKIIALSTLSQIAMMMFAIAIQSTILAFFHLIIHALFKSMMFLCAGIFISGSSYQDSRHMPNFWGAAPLPSFSLGLANLALMGLPFLSGFFSKDAIIELMILSKFSLFLTSLMILSIGMTASYSMRMMFNSLPSFTQSKPDSTMLPNNFMEIPIMMMVPFSVLMGAVLMWIITPQQMFLIPFSKKMILLSMVLMGSLLGAMLTFKSVVFLSPGKSAISLWFTHHMTSWLLPAFSNQMSLFIKLDKSWQEIYGPNYSFISISLMVKPYNKMLLSLMFLFMLLTITPISMALLF